MSAQQQKKTVLVGSYTESNLRDLIKKLQKNNIRFGVGQHFVKLIDWPKEAMTERIELITFPSDSPDKCSRIANFFELITFALKNPHFPEEVGPIEAYDDNIEQLWKDCNIKLTIPVFGIENNRPSIFLRNRIMPSVSYRLGAITM